MARNDCHYIIAIGASAGGMEEIHNFFDYTPLDGVSYIIVQHLSPDFKSHMVQLLAKHSKLKVTEAENNMVVEQNQVYFIPGESFMTIDHSRLRLTPKVKTGKPHLTINTFFYSLAAERGNKAIGVILSGTGSDGAEGVKAIKEAGGMVIVSDPNKAEFSGMPASAIATGAADFILDPKLMPQTITNYVNDEEKRKQSIIDRENDEKYITAIIDLIKENLPLDFTNYKKNTISRRIKRKATFHNFHLLQDYFEFLKTNAAEVKELAHDFLISVTAFFRDAEAFDLLKKDFIPKIIKQCDTAGEEIKLWVAGCATGEEAYSFAIILRELLDEQAKDIPVKIFATDIDTVALAHAREGIYSDSITKSMSSERIGQFFIKDNNKYTVKPEIRRMVIFASHDLVRNPPYCNMNLISCRNLLIYMTTVLQKKIYMMLHFGLKKNGYLFLGLSENAHPVTPGLELLDGKWKIYKKTEANRSALFDTFSLPAFVNLKTASSSAGYIDSLDTKNSLSEIVNETIAKDLGYTYILIDEDNQVLKTFGDTSKYLLQKNFNNNLTELLPKPLVVALNKARRQALLNNEKAVINGIKIKNNEKFLSVNLQVKRLEVKNKEQKLFYVLLSDDNSNNTLSDNNVFNEEIYRNDYTANLEEELKEVKEKLQITYDNLEASLENVQSFNEELLSTNEELQSTNEEMQSLNEELMTLNSDYSLRNKELTEMNDDMNNYFRSNQNGQLFVNPDLLLMKFSPGTVKHINLLDSDIGRPLSNISTNLKFQTIENDIREVILKGGIITREVESTDGRWYQLNTMPYIRQTDNRTDGAIITFTDITELKKTHNDLNKTNRNLRSINQDLDNFVYAASHDLLGPLANIESYISALSFDDSISQSDMREFLIVMGDAIKKFKTLIKEMAAIGKIESQLLDTSVVDLNKMVSDIKSSIAEKISISKATIITGFEVEQIRFSKKNLRSIIYNLVTNAIKYRSHERDPIITINTERVDDFILLSVQDNGAGIVKEKLEKIFSLYKRIQTEVEGQGVGLYLVRKMVNASGGYVGVESEFGKGSRFNVYFKVENGNDDAPKIESTAKAKNGNAAIAAS